MRRNTVYANRGRAGEILIEQANAYYREHGIAVVHKVPTEWLPLRGSDGRIVSAKVQRKAVCDFVGVWNAKAIAFDVKECSGQRWPLAALKPHQADFLEAWWNQGGIPFILLVHNPSDTVRVLYWPTYYSRVRQANIGLDYCSLGTEEILALPECQSISGCACDYLAILATIL